MANLRITDLTPISAVNPGDVFPVVNSSFFSNFSTTAQISAGAVATSLGTFLSVPVYNPTLSSFQPLVNKNTVTGSAAGILGGINNTASGNYSAIVGGQSNTTNSQSNTFILGSNISAPSPNYTYVNNLSSQGQVYAAALHGDGSAITNLPASVYKTAGSTPTLSTSIIPGGFGNNTAIAGYSFIAGGSGNYTSYPNTFILGSGLSASQANTTYVNNLTAQGVISTSAVFITQPAIATGNALPLTVALSAQGSVFNQIQNLAPSVSASTDLVLTNDQGLAYLDIGITSTQYNGNAVTPAFTVTQPSDSYIYAVGGNLDIGTANSNNINFFTNGTLSGNTVVVITSAGYVGINTTNPIAPLTVNGILSTNNIHYASGGNSNLWNSGYTNLTANSANWQSTYTTVTANSASWNTVYTTVNTQSGNWLADYTAVTTLTANSANWQSTYGTVSSLSSNWSTAYSYLTAVTATTLYLNNLTASGGLSATNLTIVGNISATGTIFSGQGVVGGNTSPYRFFNNNTSLTASIVPVSGSNTASGAYSIVAAGSANNASGFFSAILGGSNNKALSAGDVVAGGFYNVASGLYSNINGGTVNVAASAWATVGGGNVNQALSGYAVVAGGWSNCAINWATSIGGGYGNVASGSGSSIGGGLSNTTSGIYSTIGGGKSLSASGPYSAILGGINNCVTGSGNYAAVVAGCANTASGYRSFVGAGCGNIASGSGSVILAGRNNQATCNSSFVATGTCNCAINTDSAVIGGVCNVANCTRDTVLNGCLNIAGGCYSTILNGLSNVTLSAFDFIGSGVANTASAGYSFIAGGSANYTSYPNTFLLGSNLSASQSNFTYVNNLSVQSSANIGGNVGINVALPNQALTIAGSISATGNISLSSGTISSPNSAINPFNTNLLTLVGAASGSVFKSIQNTVPGVSASADISLYNNDGVNYIDLGIASTNYNGNLFTPNFTTVGPGDGYLYTTNNNLALGTAGTGNINFFTGGTLSASNTRATISNAGLTVTGTVYASTLSASNTVYTNALNTNTLSATTINASGTVYASTLSASNTVYTNAISGNASQTVLTDGSNLNGNGTNTLALNFLSGVYVNTYLNVASSIVANNINLSGGITAGSIYLSGGSSSVTQTASRGTTVTLNAPMGSIQLFSAATTTAYQLTSFIFNNSFISTNDNILFTQTSGTNIQAFGLYNVAATPGAGSATIYVRSLSGATMNADAPTFKYVVIKAA